MLGNNSDNEWKKFGRKNPYYWVTTKSKFFDDVLDENRKKEFFNEGRDYAHRLLKIIRRHVNPDFSPKKVLDFGCGVGRVAIPLCDLADSVVGMDISDTMLDEARKNARKMKIDNLNFVENDNRLGQGAFDFIHSIYVFQHIPWPRGRKILEKLLNQLEVRWHYLDTGPNLKHPVTQKSPQVPDESTPSLCEKYSQPVAPKRMGHPHDAVELLRFKPDHRHTQTKGLHSPLPEAHKRRKLQGGNCYRPEKSGGGSERFHRLRRYPLTKIFPIKNGLIWDHTSLTGQS